MWWGRRIQQCRGRQCRKRDLYQQCLFTVTTPSDPTGTTFDGGVGGGTGWLMVVVPVDPSTTVDLEMTIYDVSDGSGDSAVLIDN